MEAADEMYRAGGGDAVCDGMITTIITRVKPTQHDNCNYYTNAFMLLIEIMLCGTFWIWDVSGRPTQDTVSPTQWRRSGHRLPETFASVDCGSGWIRRRLTSSLSTANRHPIHCQPTPYPLSTDALSTANRRPIHCQPTPYLLPTDALSTTNH